MKHIYEKDTFVTKDIAAKINKACSLSYPEDWFSEHETPYTITVGFADGMIMDIRCCGSQDGPSAYLDEDDYIYCSSCIGA